MLTEKTPVTLRMTVPVTLYIETSALLCWLFGEPESAHVSEIINTSTSLVSSSLTRLEAYRAITRAVAAKTFTEATAGKLLRILNDHIDGWELMEISADVQQGTMRQFPHEPVRTLDAIHLSTILQFLDIYEDIAVLSLDTQILQNLPLLGLESALN